ncbi:MAG: hypothetical protein K1X75_00210 [Leptospirales bacterium]|nr:hypothetical protein [Leptospirales bacterium]
MPLAFSCAHASPQAQADFSYLEAELNLPTESLAEERAWSGEVSDLTSPSASAGQTANPPAAQGSAQSGVQGIRLEASQSMRILASGAGRAPSFAHPDDPGALLVRAENDRGEVFAQAVVLDPRWLWLEQPLENGDRNAPSSRTRLATGYRTLRFALDWPGTPEQLARHATTLVIYEHGREGYGWRAIQRIRLPATQAQSLQRGRTNNFSAPLSRDSSASTEWLHRSGAPDQKLDVLLVGEGYTREEQQRWHADAEQLMEQLFQQNPFCMFRDYFNVHRMDLVSAESGAGWGRPWTKQNSLGAYLNCQGLSRLACLDYRRAWDTIRARSPYNQRDIVIVLINDQRFGGSGGAMAIATHNWATPGVITHELGHTYAGLADEYEYGKEHCTPEREPPAANITMESSPARVKWRELSGAGVIEGANYCKHGYYRAYSNSIMRSLNAPWRELHLRAWYSRMSARASGEINVSCPSD